MRTSIDRFQLLRGDLSGRRRDIRPPWSQRESIFTDLCQRCAECSDACPTNLIKKGLDGFPMVNFSQAHCTFCGDCVKACRHQALTFPNEPTTPPWALEVMVEGSCLSSNGVVCRSCSDICGESAIHFKLMTRGRSSPRVDPLSCSGCGECVSVCPSHSITITYQ